MQASDFDWGSVPDWIAGVGTAGALILGFIVLRRDVRARSDETQRRAADDEDRRRRQASKVSGRVDMVPTPLLDGGGPTIMKLFATARNGSDEPIYRVVGLMIDSLTKEDIKSLSFVDVLPGGAESDVDVTELLDDDRLKTTHWLLELAFTDSNGNKWRRHVDSDLSAPV
jgi:hypothetical protein